MAIEFRTYGVGLAAALLILASITMTGACAADGPPQQIIIKWREVPAKQQAALAADTLKQLGARYGVALQFLRETGVGGNVYKLNPALPAPQFSALLDALSANPNVEYAEADGMMRTMPRN